MQMRYRYRIEPTPTQQSMLARVFGCVRAVFNDAVRSATRHIGLV
jgi:putative transposase